MHQNKATSTNALWKLMVMAFVMTQCLSCSDKKPAESSTDVNRTAPPVEQPETPEQQDFVVKKTPSKEARNPNKKEVLKVQTYEITFQVASHNPKFMTIVGRKIAFSQGKAKSFAKRLLKTENAAITVTIPQGATKIHLRIPGFIQKSLNLSRFTQNKGDDHVENAFFQPVANFRMNFEFSPTFRNADVTLSFKSDKNPEAPHLQQISKHFLPKRGKLATIYARVPPGRELQVEISKKDESENIVAETTRSFPPLKKTEKRVESIKAD